MFDSLGVTADQGAATVEADQPKRQPKEVIRRYVGGATVDIAIFEKEIKRQARNGTFIRMTYFVTVSKSWRKRSISSPVGWNLLPPSSRLPKFSAGRMLCGATGRVIPGANTYLLGAVPAGTLVSVYGAHLHKQATEDLECHRPARLRPTRLSA